ncbi:MAG TPA: hypothetical protein VLC09_12215, partial [Polyangiaceae bacterium]|nr:hypothetical protein [Polyangiaceae bacterium]
ANPLVLLALLPISALLAVPSLRRRGLHRAAFLASALHIYGLLVAAAFSLYPTMLPGVAGQAGLTMQAVRSPDYALGVGLCWWLPAFGIVVACQRFVYGRMPRTFSVHDDAAH